MFTHWSPIRSTCTITCKQSRHQPQIARDRGLGSQQGEDSLVDLQVAPVDAVVVGNHHLGELHVLVSQRLQGTVELLQHHVKASEGSALPAPAAAALEVLTALRAG